MYDDLIKRLRINGAGNPKNIFDEAADAIEKLSADLASNGETIYEDCGCRLDWSREEDEHQAIR